MKLLFTLLICFAHLSSFAQKRLCDSIKQQDSTIIGFATYTLYPKLPEGPLGNLVADAVKTITQIKWGNRIDVSIVSPSSIRDKIQKGTFPAYRILQVLPYEDSIAIVKLTGNELKEIANKIASQGGYPVSGIQFKIKNMKAIDINVNRVPLKEVQEYYIALPYFLILKKKIPLPENLQIQNGNLKLAQTLCEYVQWLTHQGKTIAPIPYKRIEYSN